MVDWKNTINWLPCLGSRQKEDKGKNREEVELEEQIIEENQVEEEIIERIDVQEWLDRKYPKEEYITNWKGEKVKKRSKVDKIYLNEPSLEGELDLDDFTRPFGFKVYISPQVDETKLVFTKLPKWAKIIEKAIWNYKDLINLTPEEKERTEVIDIYGYHKKDNEKMEGHLDLSEFINLKELHCHNNKLTNLTLPTNLTNLKELDLRDNNFPIQDLSFLQGVINLEKLNLVNNNFTGSLDFLSGMKNLKALDISDTNINEVNIDKLPRSLKRIYYSTEYRPGCKLTEIVSLLDKYFGKFGRCQKCGFAKTSDNWCQPCAEQEWKQLEGQELIKKFIQQQGKYSSGKDKLSWIPYEEFTNIQHLADGGFSKIYKAKWGKEYTEVVLKSLTNSQNITPEFLTEIANTKLVDDSFVVYCYGISQDPITKNYVMVMKYIRGGNLRQCLQNEGKELSLKDKFLKLENIVRGLSNIHLENLAHRDFHSGNILSGKYCHITDLGLSRPVNHQVSSQIFGVLPYVAPEVLLSQPYTKASDIYSFGIVAYELLANAYPYPKMDDLELSLKVCRGYRPDIDKVPIPQLLKDLIKRCWDADPEKRPNAWELWTIIKKWQDEIRDKKNTPFSQQYQSLEPEYNLFSQNTPYQIHPTAQLTSKMIDTKEITSKLQSLKEIGSQKIDIDIPEEEEQQAQIEQPPK
ncbi:MAG: hypothetical protein MRERV_19c025 [Mycoplasmataceae bacterium RV_VA103A]|nr:MAG: hypothetical protein MRERV_19c025 [Mycoplasmataceae bacterium RV_VA103A]